MMGDVHIAPYEQTHVDVMHAHGEQAALLILNDPINTMNYVAWVFMRHFGFSKARAHELMMRVHTQGQARITQGSVEKIEQDAKAMTTYGLRSRVVVEQ